MKSRGGARPGAGRKPVLDSWDRISVGIKCEHVLNRIARARVDQQFADDLAETNLPEFWEWINSIPVPERKAFLGSEEAKRHSQAIDHERSVLRRTYINGRYGVRRRVIREVIAWAKVQFDIDLKGSFVEDCWEEYRAAMAED